MPQIVVYYPIGKHRWDTIGHWLGPDDTTFCGRDIKHTVGWEPHDGSPYRMGGRCMRSAAVQEGRGGSARDDAESAARDLPALHQFHCAWHERLVNGGDNEGF